MNIRGGATTPAPVAVRPLMESGGKALPEGGQKLPPPPTPDQVKEAVQQIQSYLNDTRRGLQFQIDDASGRTIVRVIDAKTQEVIRQMPTEEALRMARAIGVSGGQVISDLA